MFSVKKSLDVCANCGRYVDTDDGVCIFCGTIIEKERDRKYEKSSASRRYNFVKARSTDR